MAVATERDRSFAAALESDEILIVDDAEESTAVTPPAVLVELAEVTRTGVTLAPLPAPLGPEAQAFADRTRFYLQMRLGFSPEKTDAAIASITALMPRGRR